MPRGRPRKTDPDIVLRQAMNLFWENGFEGTSMNDLVNATGMAKPGLYDCFGDKNELYAKALKLYFEEYGEPGLEDVRSSSDPLSVVLRRYLENVAKAAGNSECPGGCFVVNSIIERPQLDDEINKLKEKMLHRRSENLKERMIAAKEAGELRKKSDPDALAIYFAGQAAAIAVMAREGVEANDLRKFIDVAMQAVPDVAPE
ncbi:MAG: TetR/AcrR family transcriptional regulator [Rhizobiaceae bacterium]